MLSIRKIFILFLLLLITACNNAENDYMRIRGNALGTTYSIIVDTRLKEKIISNRILFEINV